MADKGNLYLKNSAVISLYDSTKAYETTVQETLYSQYKTAFKISKSNHFRGDAADSFKNYITNGTINIISGMMDISSDMSMIIQLFAEAFYQYEYNHDGRVEEGALDYINQTLNSKENTFEEAKGELNAVLQLASKYISTKGLSLGSVNTGYTETRNAVKKIREDLYAVDDEALKSANELLERIRTLRTLIERMMAFCYNDDGKINADNLNKIQTQDWFQTAGNVTLYLMLEEDPFEYAEGEVTLSEDQWAAGLCSDVYAYFGYSFLTVSGEAGVEDGTAFTKGKIAVLNANGYAQFTDYLRAKVNANVLCAEGEVGVEDGTDFAKCKFAVLNANGYAQFTDYLRAKVNANVLCAEDEVNVEDTAISLKGKASALNVNSCAQFTDYFRKQTNVNYLYGEGGFKIGLSDDYIGFDESRKFGYIQVDKSAIIGSNDINAYINGEAKGLCAEGKTALKFEDNGEFAIGVDANATLASASVKGGTNILNYKNKDTATEETKTLLGFNAEVSAGFDTGFALWAESETALEMEYMNINATTVKIDAAALLGLDLSVTVPTFYFK